MESSRNSKSAWNSQSLSDKLKIGGYQKTTLVDFPGTVAGIIFVANCNMRCHYCYNPDLVFNRAPKINEEEVFSELKRRQKYTNAVVVTGGEPTIWSDLPNFLMRLKDIGMRVKLDTNGTNPKMLKHIIDNGLVEYIAMDVKASRSKYFSISNLDNILGNILKSIELIKLSGIDYEFRTTVAPGLDINDIKEIATMIYPAKRWFLQEFKPLDNLVDMSESKKSHIKLTELKEKLNATHIAQSYQIRGL